MDAGLPAGVTLSFSPHAACQTAVFRILPQASVLQNNIPVHIHSQYSAKIPPVRSVPRLPQQPAYSAILPYGSLPHAERKKETERLVDIDSLWTPASKLESLFLNAKQGVAVYEYGKEQIEIIRVNNAYYEVFGYQNISQKKDIFQGIPKRYQKPRQIGRAHV